MLKTVPANGEVSKRTGEAFTCRVWVKDAIVELRERGLIELRRDVGECLFRVCMNCGS